LAVAGAIAAPTAVMAQSSTVQIGGSLNVLYYLHKPDNGSVGKKGDVLEGSEPEMTIRGEEKLGGGLTAWFQCASSFDLWGATADGFCSRNSALGMRGSFGNIFAGNWDQPQKLVYNQARGAFSGTNSLYGGTANLLFDGSASGVANPVQTITASPVVGGATGAATANSNNASRFYRRQARSWNYWSPSWNGFSVRGSFSAANEHTGLGASPLKPRMYGLSAEYRSGPLYVGLGYEQHQDWNPGNTTIANTGAASVYGGGDDTNWSLVGVYTFSNALRLSGVYSRSEYDVTNTGSLKVEGFALYADWKVQGPHTVRMQYGRVDDTKGNTTQNVGAYRAPTPANLALGTGADLWGINYEYAFSKRTAGLIGYNRLNNDGAAVFSLGKVAATAGGSQSSMGIAVKHRF